MTREEILQKAFIKATKRDETLHGYAWTVFGPDREELYRILIFSHDFAKAFWGEEDMEFVNDYKHVFNLQFKLWQYHLTQMVLEEDPLSYLERFI